MATYTLTQTTGLDLLEGSTTFISGSQRLVVVDRDDLCLAMLNGNTCWNCQRQIGSCGYRIECSNDSILVCGNTATVSPTPSYSSSAHNSSHQSSLEGYEWIPGAFITIFLLVAGFICKKCQLNPSSPKPQDGAPAARSVTAGGQAKKLEELPDHNNHDFKFFDVTEHDPIASQMQDYYKQNDWQSIKDFLLELRHQENGDSDERSYCVGILSSCAEKTWPKEPGSDTRMSEVLDLWVEAEPDCVDCRLVRADTLVSWAWHARTGVLGFMVSDERRVLFNQRLEMATAELQKAKEMRPNDALIYSIGLPVAMGRRFANGNHLTVEGCRSGLVDIAKEPLQFHACFSYLQCVCQKWGGSHEQMFAFARETTSQLPDGHPLWSLIPKAHFEYVMFMDRPEQHLKKSDVREEIKSAYAKAFPGEAETKVQATEPFRLAQEISCRNCFAYSMYLIDELEAARKQIRLIGKRPKEGTWYSLDLYKRIIGDGLGFDTKTSPANGSKDSVVTSVEAANDATSSTEQSSIDVPYGDVDTTGC